MKKWIFSAVIYLAIVIIAYYTFYGLFKEEQSTNTHDAEHIATEPDNSMESHSSQETEDEHNHVEKANSDSEVQVTVTEENGKVLLSLEDLKGNPVSNLEVNHEKLLHLIIVDEHLDQYDHLHPEETGPGKFEVDHQLKDGPYKAFVDIKPTNLSYQVQPIKFTAGTSSTEEHSHPSLQVDQNFTQTIDGNTVTLKPTSLVSDEPVTLTFDVHGAKLEPYLGAMGHVVILDEHAEEYLHVHPLNEETPVFETQFSESGIYKIWAEFQINGRVSVFPFVVEVN